jgi:hypothetical protein
METEARQIVRRHWSFVVAYIIVASLAVGVLLAIMMFLFSFIDSKHRPMSIHFAFIFMWVVSAAVFIIQLISGPLVFTRAVVCQTCHRQQRLDRIPFWAGKYYRTPKCDCGGDFEPALFWKPES